MCGHSRALRKGLDNSDATDKKRNTGCWEHIRTLLGRALAGVAIVMLAITLVLAVPYHRLAQRVDRRFAAVPVCDGEEALTSHSANPAAKERSRPAAISAAPRWPLGIALR
jgi:hypothetical protein